MAGLAAVALFSVAVYSSTTGAFDLVPSGYTEVSSGGGLYLRYLDPFPNLVECALSAPGVGETVLFENLTTWPVYVGRGYDTGSCGALMLFLNQNNSGTWTLRATFIANGTEMLEEQDLNVTIKAHAEEPPTMQMLLAVGDSHDIMAGSDDSVYCMLRDPGGQTVSINTGVCRRAVSSDDEGVWTAVYAVPGSLREVEIEYTVQAVEVELLTSVLPSAAVAGGLDVLCRLPALYSSPLLFCRMVHPNGTGMHLMEGLSDGNYSYFGHGLTREDSHDCGITIHNPTRNDLGAWRCIFAFSNGIEGGYVYVTNNSLSMQVLQGEPMSANVTALAGANVTLGCRAEASLSACWFRHPDGSLVTPERYGQSGAGRFAYFGDGLGLGSCVVRFAAQPRDSGRWTCFMGVPDHTDGDLSSTIHLEVIEEVLAALEREITTSLHESVTIGCKSVTEDCLSHCRFVHPNGWGMTFSGQRDVSAIRGRYRYAGNGLSQGECFLRITEVREEDFGEWVCAAALDTQEIGEVLTRINVAEAGGLGAGAIAAIVSVALIASGVGIAMLLGYRKRRNSSKA